MLDIKGALHVHSNYTPDVAASVADIVAAAAAAELDFVVLTDHNTLGARTAGDEGQYGPVTLFAGYEVSPALNHCLVLGYDELVPVDAPVSEYAARIREQGGLCIIAHPFSRGAPLKPGSAHPWREWQADFAGIEIWNLHQDVGDDADQAALAAKRTALAASLRGPDSATMAVWDNLTARRRVVGVAGSGVRSDEVPFAEAFRLLRNHLLVLDDWTDATLAMRRGLMLQALAAGHVYISSQIGDNAAKVAFTCRSGSGTLLMGDEGSLGANAEFVATVPGASRLRLMRAGEVVAAASGDELVYRPRHRGAYRLEAHLHDGRALRPWALTNPIYLR
ncbi:MAG: CehA/McbA family metallohydrolase [Chloroflexota bacterium]